MAPAVLIIPWLTFLISTPIIVPTVPRLALVTSTAVSPPRFVPANASAGWGLAQPGCHMPAPTALTGRPAICVVLVCILQALVTATNAANAAHTVVLLCGSCTETRPGLAVPVPIAVPVACGLLDAHWHAMTYLACEDLLDQFLL